YFDASINRVAAWVVGFRNLQKALLGALCTPNLTALQNAGDFTALMVLQEELKTMPFGEVWEEYCRRCGAPADGEWYAQVKQYEQDVLSCRG
ncbi:MAG: L-rhamnose isomerase, partial [Clostridia bacterium]|nr:L-rhamnose isomerase [Clostridia bacterium]